VNSLFANECDGDKTTSVPSGSRVSIANRDRKKFEELFPGRWPSTLDENWYSLGWSMRVLILRLVALELGYRLELLFLMNGS